MRKLSGTLDRNTCPRCISNTMVQF